MLPLAATQPLLVALGPLLAAALVVLPLWAAPSNATQHYRAGAAGEQAVAHRLDDVVRRRLGLGQGAAVLNDRQMPGRQENIDHVLVTPSGVTIVETKNWSGRLRLHEGRWYAGRRSSVDRAAAQAKRQAAAARKVLDAAGLVDVPVQAVVCLVGQARPRNTLQVKGVTVCAADQLWTALPAAQLGSVEQVRAVAWTLHAGLPPA